MASEYTLGLRPGFRFNLSDAELLQDYLRSKVLGKPAEFVLPEIDLYASLPPWDLFDPLSSPIREGQQHWYCFTPLKKKSPNSSSNFDRTVGDSGSWVASQRRHDVFLGGGVLVGHKRVYNFIITTTKTKTLWLMHEFTLPQEDEDGDSLPMLALCRVVNRIPPPPKRDPNLPLPPPLPLDAPFPFPLALDTPLLHQPPSKKQCCIRHPPQFPPPITHPPLPLELEASTSTHCFDTTGCSSDDEYVHLLECTIPQLEDMPELDPVEEKDNVSEDPMVEKDNVSDDDDISLFASFLESTIPEDDQGKDVPEDPVAEKDVPEDPVVEKDVSDHVPVDQPHCSDDDFARCLEFTIPKDDFAVVQPGAWSSLLHSSNDDDLDGRMIEQFQS